MVMGLRICGNGFGELLADGKTVSKQITRFKPDERFVPEDPAEFWGNGTQEAWLGLVPRKC